MQPLFNIPFLSKAYPSHRVSNLTAARFLLIALLCLFLTLGMHSAWADASSSPWRAVDIATSNTNDTRLLWRTPDNGFQIWNLGTDGAKGQVSPLFGPIAQDGLAWTPMKLGVESNGNTRLLLARADGAAAIWTLDSSLNLAASSPAFGPFSGWTPTDMAIARDGTPRLLWTTASGQVSLWSFSPQGTISYSPTFGPYNEGSAFWRARKIAVGGDGLVRLLWNRSDKQASIWTLDANLNFASSSPGYGPTEVWEAAALALNTSASSDNKRRVLWKRTDGQAAFWKLAPDSTTLEVNATYGPFAGWSAQALSVGGDNQMRALWNHSDGRAAFWKLSPDGTILQVNVTYGPLPEATSTPTPVPTTTPVPTVAPVPTTTPVPSGIGKIVFESNNGIYTMNADGNDRTCLTNPTTYQDSSPAFSADGQKIVFASNRDGNLEIYSMNADGSAQTRLTTNSSTDTSPKFAPDGTKIVFTSGREGKSKIYAMNVDGSGQRRLANTTLSEDWPSFSPDGSKIVFDGDISTIYTMNVDGTNVQSLVSSSVQPSYSPDGTHIVFVSVSGANNISIMNADGTGAKALTNSSNQRYSPSFSPDGSKIVFSFVTADSSNRAEIHTIHVDGSTEVRLAVGGPTSSWAIGQVAPRPTSGRSGGRIAYDAVSAAFGNQRQIYITDADGTNQEQLTFDQEQLAENTNPALSPDGRRIVFQATRYVGRAYTPSYTNNLVVMNTDGSGRQTLTKSNYDGEPAFSPDGTKILFTSSRDGNQEIYVMNADGSGQTRLTNTPDSEVQPVFSPDGTRIAFASTDSGLTVPQALFVMNSDGTNRHQVTSGTQASHPTFSADGSKLLFDSGAQLFSVNLDGSGRTALTVRPPDAFTPSYSPDGTHIVLSTKEFTASSGTSSTQGQLYVVTTSGTNPQALGVTGYNPSWGPRASASSTSVANSSARSAAKTPSGASS